MVAVSTACNAVNLEKNALDVDDRSFQARVQVTYLRLRQERGQPEQFGCICGPAGHPEPQPRPAVATTPNRSAWSRTACTRGIGSPRRVAT